MRALSTPSLFAAALALTLGLAGCATGGAAGEGSAPRGSANRIVEAELQDMQQLDIFQVIQRVRPNWLRSRGGQTAQVIVDGNPQPGRLDVLRQYRAMQVQELRFMSSSDATTRYGTGYDGGAILITTKR